MAATPVPIISSSPPPLSNFSQDENGYSSESDDFGDFLDVNTSKVDGLDSHSCGNVIENSNTSVIVTDSGLLNHICKNIEDDASIISNEPFQKMKEDYTVHENGLFDADQFEERTESSLDSNTNPHSKDSDMSTDITASGLFINYCVFIIFLSNSVFPKDTF